MSMLMAKTLIKGTPRRTAEQIAVEMESLGGHIDSYGGNNSFGVNAEVLAEDFGAGLDVLADVVLNASFPDEIIDRERAVQLASIRARRDDLLPSTGLLMRRTLFGNHGYGMDQLGSEASVTSLNPAQVRALHRQIAVPNNGVLAIFGDVKADEVKAAVEAHFARWKRNDAVQPGALPAPGFAVKIPQHVAEQRDKKQAVLVVGFPGVSMFDPDRHALDLIQESCSDLGSRLFMRIRDELGLAYYVGAQNFTGLVPGHFSFYAGTAPEAAKQVEEEILKEVTTLREEGLTDEELRRSKAKMVGHKKIYRQDLGNLAMNSALDELYGLGVDFHEQEDALVEAVTLDEVKRVAQRVLDPTRVVVAVIKPG
jgi:zinc protease